MTLSRREVLDLLASHEIRPSRALGQNFVVDPNTVRRIARLAGVGPEDHVVEIGAGLGSLTLALRETGAAVTAVELDKRLVPLLREVVEPAGARVVEADAGHASAGAGGRPVGRFDGRVVRAGAGRVRATAQDAAALARRAGRRRRVRSRRRGADGAGGGPRRRRVGQAGRVFDVVGASA